MRKIKWGVMGTAFICERSTFPGMLQAENCEMYAIAGRNMEKTMEHIKELEQELGVPAPKKFQQFFSAEITF